MGDVTYVKFGRRKMDMAAFNASLKQIGEIDDALNKLIGEYGIDEVWVSLKLKVELENQVSIMEVPDGGCH